MTDDRMPTGGPLFNLTVGTATLVACGAVIIAGHAYRNMQVAWIQLRQGSADRKLVRAENRDARRERRNKNLDEFGCDLWDWDWEP